MKILFVADLRSPIAQAWIRTVSTNHDVHALSSFALPPTVAPDITRDLEPLSLAVTVRDGGGRVAQHRGVRSALRSRRVLQVAATLHALLAPLEVQRHAASVHRAIERFQPDVVHALRIPFEGMALAAALAQARDHRPMAVSIWGNDLTLHAGKNPLMARATRRCLRAASGLHTDCRRDQGHAGASGWTGQGPTLVAPGNGGIDLSTYASPRQTLAQRFGWPSETPIVLNPRGIREYVRTDTYLKALPAVLAAVPEVRFVSTGITSLPGLSRLPAAVQERMTLLPPMPADEMVAVFQSATVSVSPSLHDGTPNTLLEAMAGGCLPIVHPVESVMEWVADGVNGIVIDARDPDSTAAGIIRGLADHDLRRRAAAANLELVRERADRGECRGRIDDFYAAMRPGA